MTNPTPSQLSQLYLRHWETLCMCLPFRRIFTLLLRVSVQAYFTYSTNYCTYHFTDVLFCDIWYHQGRLADEKRRLPYITVRMDEYPLTARSW